MSSCLQPGVQHFEHLNKCFCDRGFFPGHHFGGPVAEFGIQFPGLADDLSILHSRNSHPESHRQRGPHLVNLAHRTVPVLSQPSGLVPLKGSPFFLTESYVTGSR